MRHLLIISLGLLTAVSCGHNRQSSESTASGSPDSSKIRTLEAFLNTVLTEVPHSRISVLTSIRRTLKALPRC